MTLEDAYLSLQGLSVGDAFGERFYGRQPELLSRREPPPGPWRWTDDTHMALSIVEVLQKYGHIEQDALARAFARRFTQDPRRGYGGGARLLLGQIAQGVDWRQAAPTLFDGGSYGNGAAMRAAPIGGFFAGDPQKAAQQGQLSAQVTHAHPEGQAGAIAVAVAAAIAAQDAPPRGARFLRAVLPHVPQGETRDGIDLAQDIPLEAFDHAVQRLGTGALVSAQDTVPFCLWAAAHHLNDFAAAMWQTVRGKGDRDTTCAIVGGIVALSSRKVPNEWLHRREPLPGGERAWGGQR